MKVFWSWQSDTSGKIGRYLIRDALLEAIDQLKQAPDIEEPTAKESREAIHLDQDIQGTAGSPDLARTILEKIDNSDVVIADVTLVGKLPDSTDADGKIIPGKKLINSNVAIELGYALCRLTDKKVLMVFNGHYGRHEDLPFDLRHKGGSINFTLPPDAGKERIDEERGKLKGRFVVALRPYLQDVPASSTPFAETPSTFTKAAYFQKDQFIAQAGRPGVDEITYSYTTESLCYLRLIPLSPLPKPLPLSTLLRVAQRAPLLKARDYNVTLVTHNEYGAIAYNPSSYSGGGTAKLNASTQLFDNGEIWSISASLIVTERNGRPEWVRLPALACLLFEQTYYDVLTSLIRFADEELSLKPPWCVELGLVGIKGLHLYTGSGMYAANGEGPIRKSEVIHRMVLNDGKGTILNSLLLEFFSQVYDAAGEKRPEGFHGFPPNRPTG